MSASNTALVSVDQPEQPYHVANPLDLPSDVFRGGLNRRGENRKALIEWVRGSLVDGVDFGAVPLRRGGFSKPSLRKPGAEKICGMLGVVATFPTLKDYEAAVLEGREIRSVILRCHLLSPDGQIVADGVGARSVEQDHGDLNKTLKMALKSAHIDATLRMAGLSEIFTQDLEDMPREQFDGDEKIPHADPAHGAPSTGGAPAAPAAPRPATSERKVTEKQVKFLRVKLDQAGIPESDFLEKYGIAAVEDLPFGQMNGALGWISGVAS